MARIFFNNTANVSGTIKLGVDNPQRPDDFDGDMSTGQSLSSLLSKFSSAYLPLSDALSGNLSQWRVSEVVTTPAGRTTASSVTFENNEGRTFTLSGNLTNSGNAFALTGNAFSVDYHYDPDTQTDTPTVEFLTSAAVRLEFTQYDLSKTYETKLNQYNGGVSDPLITIGAVPNGAQLTNMTFGRGQTGLPDQMRQVAVDTEEGTWVVMQGAINVNHARLDGFLNGMTALRQGRDDAGLQTKTFNFSQANFDAYGMQDSSAGFFNPASTITINQVNTSEGFTQLNSLTQLPDTPFNTESSARYFGANVSMSESFFDSESIAFAGDDVFFINSTTDTFVEAGAGNDTVNGGSGNDVMWGGKGNDRLLGNDGNDFFLVNQNEGFGQINTWSFGQTRVGNKTVYTEKLGHDFIDGGDGIDTVTFVQPQNFTNSADWWPFSQPSPVSAPLNNDAYTGNPDQAFLVGEYRNEILVDLGVNNQEYVLGTRVVNPYDIAVVEVSPRVTVNPPDPDNTATRQVIIVDLHTRERIGAIELAQNESLARTQADTRELFYIKTFDGTSLSLQAYDFGVGKDPTVKVGTAQSYTINNGLNGQFNDFANLQDPDNTYAVFTEYVNSAVPILYKLSTTAGAEEIPIPDGLVDFKQIDWISHPFVKNSELWLAVNTNWDRTNNTWDETYLRYNHDSMVWNTIDHTTYWNEWGISRAQDAFVRYDNGFLDLSELSGGYPNEIRENGGGFELPDGSQFVTIYAQPNMGGVDPGYERWLVIDTDGNITTDRSFDKADNTSPASLGVRGFEKIQEIDGYFYFQTFNGSFNGSDASNITSITQPPSESVSVYRVATNSIDDFLQWNNAVDSNPHVEKVRDFSKAELTGNSRSAFASLQEYLPISAVQAGNLTGGAYFVSSDFDPVNDIDRLFLGKVEANGTVSSRTLLPGNWIDDYVVHPQTGQWFLLTSSEANNYSQQAYEFNTISANLRPISESQWREASTNIPEVGSLSYSGEPGLQLILPTAYYGDLPTRLTDGETYVSRWGELGFRTDSTQEYETYALGQGPADGTIGVMFDNSYSGQKELLHLKDVEYIEMPNADGNLEMYDIRPLYLASRGNDTLYGMSRSHYDSLVTIFNNQPEYPNDFPDALNDPLAWYRNSFRLIDRPDGLQWRYYVNGGAGNDTIHGTKDDGQQSEVDRITFEWDFAGSVEVTLTHADFGTRVVTLERNPGDSWFWFNREFGSKINDLQIGLSGQRGVDDRELILSGLALTGWDASYDITGTSTYNASEPYVVSENVDILEKGRDTLDGGTGADTMIGYSGSDTYFVDNFWDKVIESPFDEGFDTVFTTASYVLQGDTSVERLQVHHIQPGWGGSLIAENRNVQPASDRATINITGNNYTYEFLGHDGNNTITAGSDAGIHRGNHASGAGAFMLGMGGNDRLVGSERNDHLLGGVGNDTLLGNDGDDRFYMGFQQSNQSAASLLLPSPNEFGIIYNQGLINHLGNLTGGDDVAIGGDGFDTVVVGTAHSPFSPADSITYYQRVNENQIRIYTLTESMLVDSSMEAVEFLTWDESLNNGQGGHQVETRLLPWVSNQTQRDNDLYFANKADPDARASSFAYVPATNFSDWIDLDGYTALDQALGSSFDGSNGNDVIFGDSTGLFSTLRGGWGNDFLYAGHYDLTDGAPRYELYGDGLNDTLTLDPSRVTFADGDNDSKAQFLLDGGTHNDHYRVRVNNDRAEVRIEDVWGRDTLTLAFDDYDSPFYVAWDSNELRVYTRNDQAAWQVFLSAPMGALEELYLTEDSTGFSESLIGGNLIRPVAWQYDAGRLWGTGGNDILLPMMGVKLDYDGGGGDDVIFLNNTSGGVVSGGAGNDLIFAATDLGLASDFQYTISYQWANRWSSAEINLNHGYGYVDYFNGALLGTDRWEGNFITDVIGGAGNDRIWGNDRANVLDGGFGNDILYSGRNTSQQTNDPNFDHLIGGFGNDTLVEETHWTSARRWGDALRDINDPNSVLSEYGAFDDLFTIQGSLLEGGAGNDVYAIQHNGAPPTMLAKPTTGNDLSNEFFASGREYRDSAMVMPTRIVERDSNTGRDTGGADTIRTISSSADLTTIAYEQTGTTVRAEVTESDIAVGDTLMANFLTGRAASNVYTVTRVTPVLNEDQTPTGRHIVEFEVDVWSNFTGQMHLTEINKLHSLGHWVDNDTMALFAESDMFAEVLNDISNGMSAVESVRGDGLDGYIKSALPVIAMIDRNALEFVDIGSNDPEQAGMVMPISFNVGRSNAAEFVVAGGPGNAVLFGGNGTDFIFDTLNDDILIGGDGNDIMGSYVGFDIVDGGAGNDLIQFRSDTQILIGGSGADEFKISGVGNKSGALIADYKPWEGDTLSFEKDWLKNFMDGQGRVFGPAFDEIEFFTRVAQDPLFGSSFTIGMDFNVIDENDSSQTTNVLSVDLVRIQYHSDLDLVYKQEQEAMQQLFSSADSISELLPQDQQWNVVDPSFT